MTVNPGLCRQSFIESQLKKIEAAPKRIEPDRPRHRAGSGWRYHAPRPPGAARRCRRHQKSMKIAAPRAGQRNMPPISPRWRLAGLGAAGTARAVPVGLLPEMMGAGARRLMAPLRIFWRRRRHSAAGCERASSPITWLFIPMMPCHAGWRMPMRLLRGRFAFCWVARFGCRRRAIGVRSSAARSGMGRGTEWVRLAAAFGAGGR